jgi:hypothetical protein
MERDKITHNKVCPKWHPILGTLFPT